MYQMIRTLCLVLGLCCVSSVAYATPNNSDYRTQSITYPKTKHPTLFVVQHNLLDDFKLAHTVMYMFSKAYTNWTGNMIITPNQVRAKFGKYYGSKILNACSVNQATCILNKIKAKFGHTKFDRIILFSIGGLNQTVMLSTYFLYPKNKRVRKGPHKLIKKRHKIIHECGKMVKKAFPNHGTFSIKGLPTTTKIWVRGTTYSISENYVILKKGKRVSAKRMRKIPIPANKPIKAWAFVPGRAPMKIKVFKIRPRQNHIMTILLPDIVMNVVPTNPRPKPRKRIKIKLQPPTPPQPFIIYKKWWFWTGIGVIAAGTTVGIVIATLPPKRLENDHIIMQTPH